MGLAASQARFLGITLRKANCEFKSTELAQQRLELSNQMTDITQDYSNALNATKLVWHNDAVCDSFGNPMDFGITYNLIMMPSAANDFNPYMVSSRSGAVVLNSKYAQAARDAGIPMSGGIASAAGRQKFLDSLATSTTIKGVSQHDNIITAQTRDILSSGSAEVAWQYSAGLGAIPKNKSIADITDLQDLKEDSDIGKRTVDWLQIARGLNGQDFNGALTETQAQAKLQGEIDNFGGSKIGWLNSGYTTNQVNINDMFTTGGYGMSSGTFSYGSSMDKLTLVVNDVIVNNATEIKNMTISDLLSRNVTIITQDEGNANSAVDSVSKAGQYLMDYIGSVFGVGKIGVGLNIDNTTNDALNMAMSMVKKKFLNPGNVVRNGGEGDTRAMMSNSAYKNANNFNRIGATEDGRFAALNLSNMVSAFLTYFDNFLRGSESAYVVGKGNTDGKTVFVTDDTGYSYVTNATDKISDAEKIADFFNELYNNICAHGWRYDDMVQDNEYLQSAIKDGRYQLMALNPDGYFYQSRYNDIGYLEEVQDEDAITRAEVAFTTKKAEITFKEDQIDVKTKKLDAEISELNTEISSVQNIISKSIEKTFSMFSN